MRTRRLRPATIIPPDLYVERDADRQVRDILNDMGRPGYILVARQMGKTNLLLNARRKLENEFTKFVYVDLSNKVSSLADYYRVILDTASSVHKDVFKQHHIVGAATGSPNDNIAVLREFETGLRAMLSEFPGRIVIVLDEIDSLANTGFSDQVFSQIRSMYFARANFPDYDRLTYILSGVAEPSDLIKDKSISPFNIGHKIYLNDFSESEYRAFVEKAGLNLNPEAAIRIFAWAKGNPRITWDICSEAEGIELSGRVVTADDIDAIVQKLYLTSFDRAPIDHIRTLVETDRDIRDALIQLKRGDTRAITDALKSRLYLAGITASVTASEKITIKNRVIQESLSDAWLNGLQIKYRGLINLAKDAFSERRYVEAISHYETYLRESSLEDPIQMFRLGLSYFHAQRFSEAIRWLDSYRARGTKPDSEASLFYLARSYHRLQDFSRATKLYRETLENQFATQYHNLSRAYLAASLVQANFSKNRTEALELLEQLLASDASGDSPHIIAGRAQAASTLASIQRADGNAEDALKTLDDALKVSPAAYRPQLVLQAAETVPVGDPRRSSYLTELSETFVQYIDSNVSSDSTDSAGIIDDYWWRALLQLRMSEDRRGFESLLRHAESKGFSKRLERQEILKAVWELAQATSLEGVARELLIDIIDQFRGVASATAVWRESLSNLIITTQAKVSDKYQLLYLETLRPEISDQMIASTEVYFSVMYIAGEAYAHAGSPVFAKAAAIASRLALPPSGPGLLPALIVRYYLFLSHQRDGDLQQAERDAYELLNELGPADEGEKPAVGEAAARTTMRDAARQFLAERARHQPVVNPFKAFGRNQRVYVKYADGQIVERKFKQVERDLAVGKCELVNPSVASSD